MWIQATMQTEICANHSKIKSSPFESVLAEISARSDCRIGRSWRENRSFGPCSTRILVGNVAMQLRYGLLLGRNHPLHQIAD
jgi:hypothetical protein